MENEKVSWLPIINILMINHIYISNSCISNISILVGNSKGLGIPEAFWDWIRF